jgi:hypothetical protein
VHTVSQVLQVSVDDVEGTLVDGGDEFGETMPWFTKEGVLIRGKTFPKTTTDYPGWRVSSTSWYDR